MSGSFGKRRTEAEVIESPAGPRSNRGGALSAQRERAAMTRSCLLIAGRALFTEAGYHATGTTEIVERAAVTRGALYHHFAGKENLFAEIFRTVAEELVTRTNAAVAPLEGGLWDKVGAAFERYLELVAANGQYQRILLIDGPAVLGWARWRELLSEFVATGTADALERLMDEGLVERQPAEPLANLIQAALHDVALTIAHAPESTVARERALAAFLSLLRGLRTDAVRDCQRPVARP